MNVIDLPLRGANDAHMPKRKRPLPLRAKEPPVRDPKVPDALWGFPARLVKVAWDRSISEQGQLAARSGVSQGVISRILNYRNLVGIQAYTVARLAKALEVSIDRLLVGIEETTPRMSYEGVALDPPTARRGSSQKAG